MRSASDKMSSSKSGRLVKIRPLWWDYFYCPVVRLLCSSFLKDTQFACYIDNSLPSIAVLFVSTRARCPTGESTVFASRDENGDRDDQDERSSRGVVSSHHLVASVTHQLKAKVERERLYSENLLKGGWL